MLPKEAFCVSASSKVLIFDPALDKQIRVPLLAVPRKSTLVGSNKASLFSSRIGAITAPGVTAAMAVPSFGAMALMYAAARALPAPGMFLGTIVGWPGM